MSIVLERKSSAAVVWLSLQLLYWALDSKGVGSTTAVKPLFGEGDILLETAVVASTVIGYLVEQRSVFVSFCVFKTIEII